MRNGAGLDLQVTQLGTRDVIILEVSLVFMGSMIQRRSMEILKFVPKAEKEDGARMCTRREAAFYFPTKR